MDDHLAVLLTVLPGYQLYGRNLTAGHLVRPHKNKKIVPAL